MEPILRPSFIADWTAGLLLVSLVLLVVSKERFSYRFSVFMNLISNTKYILVFNKKQGFVHPFQIIWQGFAILNISLFLFLNLNSLSSLTKSQQLLDFSFVHILIFVALFVWLKQLLQLIHGLFFKSLAIMKEFMFKKSSYFNYASLVLFLSNLIYIFLWRDSIWLFIISLVLAGLITVVGWMIVLRNRQKYITDQFFYFILYLCALEIAPFLILGTIL